MPNSKQNFVSVEFHNGLSIEQVVDEIKTLSNPQIIVWYIGCYGLRKSGADYYKQNLFTPLLQQNFQCTFWLSDLTAWNAFKNPRSSINKSSRCCDLIETYSDTHFKCIRSSKIFKKMQEIT